MSRIQSERGGPPVAASEPVTRAWSIAPTASITLASEGRSSALAPPCRPAPPAATNSRIPMTDGDGLEGGVSRRPALDDASKLAERNPGPRGEGSQPFRLDPLTNQLYKGHLLREVSSAPVRTSRRNAVAGSVRVAPQREMDPAEPSTGPDERKDLLRGR